MSKSVELMKKGEKSLIMVTHDSGNKEFVVATGYDANAPFGSQWYWGHYFGDDLENAVDYIRRAE